MQKILGRIINDPTILAQENIPSYESIVEVSQDSKDIYIWFNSNKEWLQLPYQTPVLTRNEKSRVQDIRCAKEWKKVHSLTERLYKKQVEFHEYIVRCEEINRLNILGNAEASQNNDASNCFRFLKQDFQYFSNDLEKLQSVNQTAPVKVLCKIPDCSDAIERSLGVKSSANIENLSILTSRITKLLYNALHIADQQLESYFQKLAS